MDSYDAYNEDDRLHALSRSRKGRSKLECVRQTHTRQTGKQARMITTAMVNNAHGKGRRSEPSRRRADSAKSDSTEGSGGETAE